MLNLFQDPTCKVNNHKGNSACEIPKQVRYDNLFVILKTKNLLKGDKQICKSAMHIEEDSSFLRMTKSKFSSHLFHTNKSSIKKSDI